MQWGFTDNFYNGMAAYDSISFYYNLQGEKPWMEQGNDFYGHGPDTVDLYLQGGHGGYDHARIPNVCPGSHYAQWATYEFETYGCSSNMRLGDNGHMLSVFASFACQTMYLDDGLFMARWAPILNGGLRMALGMHNDNPDASPERGTAFAQYLQEGYPFYIAWVAAMLYNQPTTPAMVVTTAQDANSCYSKFNNMSWNTMNNYTRYRDGAIGWTCWSYWN
jgi:hypothetical protein